MTPFSTIFPSHFRRASRAGAGNLASLLRTSTSSQFRRDSCYRYCRPGALPWLISCTSTTARGSSPIALRLSTGDLCQRELHGDRPSRPDICPWANTLAIEQVFHERGSYLVRHTRRNDRLEKMDVTDSMNTCFWTGIWYSLFTYG